MTMTASCNEEQDRQHAKYSEQQDEHWPWDAMSTRIQTWANHDAVKYHEGARNQESANQHAATSQDSEHIQEQVCHKAAKHHDYNHEQLVRTMAT